MSDETTTEAPAADLDDDDVEALEAKLHNDEPISPNEAKRLRREIVKYRTERNEAWTAGEKADADFKAQLGKIGDENADLQVQLAVTELTVTKYQAMIDEGIPTELMPEVIKLVNGHDPETIAESVASAKKLMGSVVREPAADPLQGSGNTMALNSDALEEALRRAVGI